MRPGIKSGIPKRGAAPGSLSTPAAPASRLAAAFTSAAAARNISMANARRWRRAPGCGNAALGLPLLRGRHDGHDRARRGRTAQARRTPGLGEVDLRALCRNLRGRSLRREHRRPDREWGASAMTLSPAWQDLWIEAKHVDMVGVAERLGAKFKRGSRGEMTSACPLGCAKKDGFVVDPGKGLFLCRPSGAAGDVIQMIEHLHGCSRVEAAEFLTGRDRPNGSAQEDDEKRAERARKREQAEAQAARRMAARDRLEAAKLVRDGEAVASILDRAFPFPGSRAEDYMLARGAGMPKSMTRDLRFVDELHYWGFANAATEDVTLLATLPAMVALIRALDGETVGVHITYLDPRSPKKWVAPWEADLPKDQRRNVAKKFRKTVAKLNGAMIRLGVISDTIVLGEGLETTGSYYRRGFAPEDASFGVA